MHISRASFSVVLVVLTGTYLFGGYSGRHDMFPFQLLQVLKTRAASTAPDRYTFDQAGRLASGDQKNLLFWSEEWALLISRLLNDSSVPPEEIERLDDICRRILRRLHLVDRKDPLTESIGRKLIDLDRSGVSDFEELARQVSEAFGWNAPSPIKSRRRESRDGGSDRP
jgi:hypothetical protein